MSLTSIKPNHVVAVLAGASAAAVTVLSVGGYLLHRKVLKHRLQEQARQQAMSLAMFNLDDGEDFFYNHDEDEEYDDDYITRLMDELEQEDNA